MKKLMIILCTILCANILAAQTFTSGGLKYQVVYNSYSVTVAQQNSSAISGSVVIPSTVTYNGTTYSVTSIGNYAFDGCSGLTSVTIPNSVTYIGYGAFWGCSSLTSVTIPNSVTYIGYGAFDGCSGLTSINVASGNTHYSSIDGVLYNCVQDTLIQCPGAKTSVTIPNSVTSIGGGAFAYCSGLTSINVASGNTHYSSIDGVLYNYVQDTLIRCPGAKTSITIGTGVTYIGYGAFSGCSGLTSINVASGNTHYSSIDGVLYNYVQDTLIQCPGAKTSVTIPTGVTSIGSGAFYGCSGLTSINVASGNTHYSSIDGVLYNYVQDTLIQCPGAKTSVTIPTGVTFIGDYAFFGCDGLTSVTIGNSVTSIGGSAFYGCSGLTSINVASGNTHYSSIDGVLYNYVQNTLIQCPGAKTSVTIPNSVTSIGGSAFENCSSLTTLNFNAINYPDINNTNDYFHGSPFVGTALTTVNIGDSVQRIPANIFRGCINLTTLNFNAINCHFQRLTSYGLSYCPFDGIPLTTVNIGDSVQRIPNNFVRGCGGLTSVTIPNSVTSIGDSAFYGCSGLTSITIPNSVTSIGGSAFSGCSGLTSVSIPNSVTSIGGSAFSGCSGLTSVTIPNGVTSIGGSAFRGCTSLTSVTIGNSVTSIGTAAFYGCSGLTTLNFNAIDCQDFEAYYNYNGHYYYTFGTSLTTVNIGDSVQRIPAYFVKGCSGLTSITLPNSLTSIGEKAFEGCSGLTSVSIPNSVTSIGGSAFNGCSSLTSVTIGNSLTSIGDRAFYECLNLSSLISSATVPPTIGNEAFPYPNICTVTVPCGSLAAYTASTCYWSVYFPQRITESSSFELSVSANEEAYGRVEVETQSCNVKTLTAIANNGYEFTGWNDGNMENPRTITLTSDTAFTAIFAETETAPTITVTVNDATMGSASYTLDGNTAVLTATPNEGYEFTGWNDGNTENPRTVTITSDTTFMAIFTEAGTTPIITVTVNDATMGSASYTLDGNTAVLTATPNEGYRFLTWNDGNMENPRTITLTSDTAFMAIFTASGSSSLQAVNTSEFAIYPNPAKSFVTLEFETLQENTLLQILDINGRRVRTLDLKAGIETLRIDVSDLPKGVYTVILGNTTKKLIVE